MSGPSGATPTTPAPTLDPKAVEKEETKPRKEITSEESAEFKALGEYRKGQAADRKKLETEEDTARKAALKDEKAGWDALEKLYKDEAKERKKMEDEETTKREKGISKERNDEWVAINKYWEKSTKDFNTAIKQCESGETSARLKLEKEQLGELDALGKHRDKEAAARKSMEDSEDKPRKDVEKDWLAGHEAIGKLYQARRAVLDFLQISEKAAGDWDGAAIAAEKVVLVAAEVKSDATYYNIEVTSGPAAEPYVVQARYSVFDSLKLALSSWGVTVDAPFPGKAQGMLGSLFKKQAAKAVDERKVQLNTWIQQAVTVTRGAIEKKREAIGAELSEAISKLTVAEEATAKAVADGEEARKKRNEERRQWFAEHRERLEVYAKEAEEARRKDQQLIEDREKARLERKKEWQEAPAADLGEEKAAEDAERAKEEAVAAEAPVADATEAAEDAAAKAAAEAERKEESAAAEAAKSRDEEAAAKAAAEAAKEQKEALETLEAQEKEVAPPARAKGKSVFEDDSSDEDLGAQEKKVAVPTPELRP